MERQHATALAYFEESARMAACECKSCETNIWGSGHHPNCLRIGRATAGSGYAVSTLNRDRTRHTRRAHAGRPRHIKHTERETCSLYLRAGHTHHSTTDPEFSMALSLPNTPHTRMSCCCECATRIMLTDLGGPPLGHTHTAVADLISPPAAPALGTALQDQRGRGPVEVSTPAPVMRPGCR